MFFIGLAHSYDVYFFELLITFWLTLVGIYCLEFISHYIKEILYVNKNSKGNQSWNNHEIKAKRYRFSIVSDIDVQKFYFL